MKVKSGSEVDCSWFMSDLEGSAITSCSNIKSCWVLNVGAFGGASDSSCTSNT